MNCHIELPALANIANKFRRQCPVCGGYYYEDRKTSMELSRLEDAGR